MTRIELRYCAQTTMTSMSTTPNSMVRFAVVTMHVLGAGGLSRADEILYAYEGGLMPYDPSAGWIIADSCAGPCSESLLEGYFANSWQDWANTANYHLWISTPKDPPPPAPPFWVEWSYSSNNALGMFDYSCDGRFVVDYRQVFCLLYLFGDAVVSFDGGTVRRGFTLGEFRSHRFETPDGAHFTVHLDGKAFPSGGPGSDNGYNYLQFGGNGLCSGGPRRVVNRWDFVRYGRITYGEQIIASSPPGGWIDARRPFSRFTVTFDEPNYVFVNQIAVSVDSNNEGGEFMQGEPPRVTAVRRRENSPPEEVEIVLDRPVPYKAITRFTFDDGEAINVVEFIFAPGDTDGDGDADLADFADFQTCFSQNSLEAPCPAVDLNNDWSVDLVDALLFVDLLSEPSN